MRLLTIILTALGICLSICLFSQGFVYDGADGLDRYHYHPYNDCTFQVLPGSEDLGQNDPLISAGPFNEVVGIHPDSTFVYGVRLATLSWWNTSTLEIGQDIFAFGIPAFDDIGEWTDFTLRNDTMYLTARNGHIGVYDLNTGAFQQRIFPNENLGSGITFYKDNLLIGQMRDANDQLLPKPRYYYFNTDLTGNLELQGEIELAAAGLPANINGESTFCTAQYHCEDVRVYLEGSGSSTGRDFNYFYPETGEVFYVCDIFSDNISSIGFPEWSSCRLSIDLDLDDEPIQFNRDYALAADCPTELQVVDEDVQVFASVGAIDSITVVIRAPIGTMRLEGMQAPALTIRGNYTSELAIINQGTADFDAYEEVMKSLRFMSDLAAFDGQVEIDFRAHYQGEMGSVSTTTLDIRTTSLTPAQDTTLQVCSEEVVVDASIYNGAIGGEWLASDSLFMPGQDPSQTVLSYAYGNGCVEDTSTFTFVVESPALSEQRLQTICDGDSIRIAAVWYSTDTLFIDTLAHSLTGCDSLYVGYQLDFSSAAAFAQRDTLLCYGDTLRIDGQDFAEDITLTDTLRYSNGCDSLVQELQVRFTEGPVLISERFVLCPGDSVEVEGLVLSAAGFYPFVTLFESVACDSLIHEVEIVNADMPSLEQIDFALCAGDSLMISGEWQSESGMYRDTIQSFRGCDSLVIMTNLEVGLETSFVDAIVELCPGEAVALGGMRVEAAGIVYDTLLSASGCDSLITEYTVSVLEIDLEITEFDFGGQVGDTLVIAIELEAVEIVSWLDGEGLSCMVCAAPELILAEEGLFTYQVAVESAEACLDTVLVRVTAEAQTEVLAEEEMTELFYLPNILNNSAGNDRLYVQAADGTELLYDLLVYDRWGNVRFDSADLPINVADAGWAPYESGVESGVYVYLFKIGEERLAGTITVLD